MSGRVEPAVADPWAAWTTEERLLERYWNANGGRLYLQIPIGWPGPRNPSPALCNLRRVDAIRFLSGRTPDCSVRYWPHRADFITDLNRFAFEIITLTRALDHRAIGRAIANRRMFARKYRVYPRRTLILCSENDTALAWVCDQEDVEVEDAATGAAGEK